MKKNKDRMIHIDNLEDGHVVYTIRDKNVKIAFGLLGLLVSVMLFYLEVMMGILAVFILLSYIIFTRKKVRYQICDDAFIKYVDKETAEIIYFDEILNYQIVGKFAPFTLTFLLSDGDEYEYTFSDPLLIKHLHDLIGDKYVQA